MNRILCGLLPIAGFLSALQCFAQNAEVETLTVRESAAPYSFIRKRIQFELLDGSESTIAKWVPLLFYPRLELSYLFPQPEYRYTEIGNLMEGESDAFRYIQDDLRFKDIGIPQVASLTRVKGKLYGLVLTSMDERPDSLKGITAGYGLRFGGISAPRINAAVLMDFSARPTEILKIYKVEGQSTRMFQEAVSRYAYYELVKRLDPQKLESCARVFRSLE